MTKLLCEIEIDLSPETVANAQHVINQWTRFNPLEIHVKEVIED